MTKPYELKALEERLKAAGLPEVEQLARKVYEAFTKWVRDSAVISETPLDDIGIPFISYVDGLVLPEIAKIDGK